jgi:Fic-DOC domain mobile mystery protein B
MPLAYATEGNTPLTPEELAQLIPALATREELNEWERANILEADRWAMTARNLRSNDPLTEEYIRKLHRKMFDQTWKWAGAYRNTERNIGVPAHEIREKLMVLLGDARFQVENNTWPPDEIAVHFHHRLVQIHPFPNGNGRHGRLIADVLIRKLGGARFTWGREELIKPGEARRQYLHAMKTADAGDIRPLLEFVRV